MKTSNLDHLRALAVLLVLCAHSLELIEFQHPGAIMFPLAHHNIGRVGVLLFFVHTSTVLCTSMQRLNLSGMALVRSFLIRRAFRIYPLSVLAVLIVVAFNVPTLPWMPDGGAWTSGELMSNLALTMNVTYSRPLLTPFWSLPLEVQMYVVLPVIFLMLGARRHPLTVLAMLVAAVAFATVQPMISNRLNVVQFAPCFLAGVLAYTLSNRVQARLPAWAWMPLLLALTCAYVVLAPLPGEGVMQPQWLICLVTGAAIPMFRDSKSATANSATHTISQYSYGIYLFHAVALWVGCVVLQDALPILQWATAAALLVALSVGSYHLIESPAIGVGSVLAKAQRARHLPAEVAP